MKERPAERPALHLEVQVRRLAFTEGNFPVDAQRGRGAELIVLQRLGRLRADGAGEGVGVERAVRVRDPEALLHCVNAHVRRGDDARALAGEDVGDGEEVVGEIHRAPELIHLFAAQEKVRHRHRRAETGLLAPAPAAPDFPFHHGRHSEVEIREDVFLLGPLQQRRDGGGETVRADLPVETSRVRVHHVDERRLTLGPPRPEIGQAQHAVGQREVRVRFEEGRAAIATRLGRDARGERDGLADGLPIGGAIRPRGQHEGHAGLGFGRRGELEVGQLALRVRVEQVLDAIDIEVERAGGGDAAGLDIKLRVRVERAAVEGDVEVRDAEAGRAPVRGETELAEVERFQLGLHAVEGDGSFNLPRCEVGPETPVRRRVGARGQGCPRYGGGKFQLLRLRPFRCWRGEQGFRVGGQELLARGGEGRVAGQAAFLELRPLGLQRGGVQREAGAQLVRRERARRGLAGEAECSGLGPRGLAVAQRDFPRGVPVVRARGLAVEPGGEQQALGADVEVRCGAEALGFEVEVGAGGAVGAGRLDHLRGETGVATVAPRRAHVAGFHLQVRLHAALQLRVATEGQLNFRRRRELHARQFGEHLVEDGFGSGLGRGWSGAF